MRILIQRVSRASVTVDSELIGSIGHGLVAFVGIHEADTEVEVQWMAEKTAQIRIFEDNLKKMNLSLMETGGSVLAVSQFTLYGDLKKGNRPNFMAAAEPERAERLYEDYLTNLRGLLGTDRVAN